MLLDFGEGPSRLCRLKRMTLQRQRRPIKDTLLLSIWVIGYCVLMQTFAVLQRFERLLAGSKREAIREAPQT